MFVKGAAFGDALQVLDGEGLPHLSVSVASESDADAPVADGVSLLVAFRADDGLGNAHVGFAAEHETRFIDLDLDVFAHGGELLHVL